MVVSFDYGTVMNPPEQARPHPTSVWRATKEISVRYISTESVSICSEIAMLMGYATIGFHSSHLEVGVNFLGDTGRGKVTLHSIPISRGAICDVSGCLQSPILVRDPLREVLNLARKGSLVQVALGVPDSLCRSSVTREVEAAPASQRQTAESSGDSDGRRVEAVATANSAYASKGALVVSAMEREVMHYADLCTENSMLVSRIIPHYIARRNCAEDLAPEAFRDQCLLLRVCESSFDLALWSGSLPLLQDRYLREGSLHSWIHDCQARVARLVQRIEGNYRVLIRGPEDLVSQLRADLEADRPNSVASLTGELEESVAVTDIELYRAGHFDVTVGLLAQARVETRRVRDRY